MRVLVIDDDAAGRYLLRSILGAAGHDVIEAQNGEEALEVARQDPPDVAVTDILMPRMDGYQLCRSWKLDPTLSSVPIAFYTASYTDPADERFALSLGADAFWRKPLGPDELLASVEGLAGLRAPRAATRMPEITDEKEILHEYNERLVSKLEEKAASLGKANAELRRALELLAEEVAVKSGLISELNADVMARKKVEADLRAERDFTRKVVEFADLFLCVMDTTGTILLFSEGAARITGYTPAEALGKRIDDLLATPLACSSYREDIEQVVRTQEPLRHLAPLRHKDGRTRMLEFSLSPTRDDDGKVVSLSAFALDVTERRNAAAIERLAAETDRAVLLGRPSSETLRLVCDLAVELFDLAFVWAGLRAEDGTVAVAASAPADVDFLDALRAACGTEPQLPMAAEALRTGKVVRAVVAESTNESWAAQAEARGYASALAIPLRAEDEAAGVIVFYSRDALAFDGDFRTLLERLGEHIGLSVMLTGSQARLRLQSAALESAGDAIAITDGEQRIQWANRAFAQLMRHAADTIPGVRMREFSPDDDAYASLLRSVEAARQSMPVTAEVVGLRFDGSRFYERVTVTAVRMSGEAERFIWIIQDVTERRKLDQLRANFVATVSHELRTPLTSIIGYTDLLIAMPAADLADKASPLLANVRSHSVEMQRLVEALLEVSTIQAEGMHLARRPVSIDIVLRAAAEQVSLSPRHRLTQDVAPDVGMCTVDPERLGRAVSALVSNAVKYSPEGGTVNVTVRHDGGELSIAVSDEGIGIAPEDVEGLFDRFVQGDMSTTRSYGGLGLGLFMANEIVKAHDGRIDVRSELGKGSTFTIVVPC